VPVLRPDLVLAVLVLGAVLALSQPPSVAPEDGGGAYDAALLINAVAGHAIMSPLAQRYLANQTLPQGINASTLGDAAAAALAAHGS
jgi:hypothetical protein